MAFSEEFTGSGADLFRVACEHELEGIVSKRLDAPYRSGRSHTWLKTNSVLSEPFEIIATSRCWRQAIGIARRGSGVSAAAPLACSVALSQSKFRDESS